MLVFGFADLALCVSQACCAALVFPLSNFELGASLNYYFSSLWNGIIPFRSD